MQFDPAERTTNNGQDVRDIVVQAVGSGGKNVKITLWPEYGHVAVEKGTFVAANGKYTEDVVNGTTYRNLSASVLKVWPSESKSDSDVENKLPEDSDQTPEEELLF